MSSSTNTQTVATGEPWLEGETPIPEYLFCNDIPDPSVWRYNAQTQKFEQVAGRDPDNIEGVMWTYHEHQPWCGRHASVAQVLDIVNMLYRHPMRPKITTLAAPFVSSY